jgi:hypothetical protein
VIQRHPLAFVLALALLVAFPAVFFGFWIDDYYHLTILELGDQVDVEIGGPFDLFYFAPGDPEIMKEALNSRPLPWFTLPELHLHFFRPLTSALFTLDHALWGLNPLPYHVHSMIWYLVLVAAVWAIFRRTLPIAVALLAAALFAIDDVHNIPVVWIANRNGLLAVALVFLGLAAHIAWRRDQWRPGIPVSMLCYALGLAAGEAAVGAMAYIAAYELINCITSRNSFLLETRNPNPETRPSSIPHSAFRTPRFPLPLLPAALVGIPYLLFYKLAGYGVSGSGMYLDPFGEPLKFLRLAPERILSLIGAQVLAFPAEISIADPRLVLVTAVAGLLSLALLLWLFTRVWPHLCALEKHALGWLLLGAMLALVPVAATFPSSRLLMAPSLGFAAAIAVILYHGWKHRNTWSRPARAILITLTLIHCVAAPITWWAQTAGLTLIARYHDELFRTAQIRDDPGRDRLVFLRAPEPFSAFYATAVRALHGHPMPRSTWSLSLSPHPQELHRVDAQTLELKMIERPMLDSPIEQLFRSPDDAFAPGETVEIDGLTIQILETDGRFPTRLRYTFDHPLETGPYQFIGLENGRLVTISPPPIGQRQTMERPAGIFGIELRHLFP